MSFVSLSASLKLNIQDFSTKLNEASRRMSSFATSLNQDYGRANAALKSHNLGLKDTARIVQGIMVSQAFYGAANAIADATRSLWDFNVALDYMHVTYSALFSDSKVASDFMTVLQEHSVDTIFDYQNLADASKKLLAYGIEYENLMFIMEGLTNLGTMSGDSAALDRIALALGQIYTKGKLSAEEMRQLANAYIPITDILQDKFGLTGDDLKRVGDLNLPAADVINAIVDYANENFGSVGDAAMYTITGLQNKIVDTLKVVGAQMLKPITTAYKSFLAYVANGLEAMRREFEAGGVGGIFEYLVPDESTQQVIRQFIANVKNLFMSLISVGIVVGQVFGNFASVFATAFNIVSPLVIGFTNVLASLLNAMLQNRTGAMLLRIALVAAAGAFVVLKVQAAAALVITAVTKAVTGLSKALLILATIVSKHPILSLLAGLAITMVGVASASKGANKSISGLFDTISGVGGGTSSGDVLQKVEQGLTDSSSAADQFSNRLENATDAAKNLSKAIGGAGGAADKAAKKTGGLLSFDEVYKLPDPAEESKGSGGGSGVGSGLLGDLENLAAGLGGLGDSLIPDIPDFSEFISEFIDGLFGGLEQGIFKKLASTGIGALIGGGLGAIIGGLLGGPGGALLGAKIGALAGGVVGLLWEAFDGAISNTIAGAAAGIAAVISKAFGIGFSGLVQLIAKGTSIKNIFSGIGYALKTAGLKSILKGGIIGAAIGIFVDGFAHLLWGTLEERFAGANSETAKVGQTIGSVIGAIVGGLLGGPAGVLIGSAIGTFAGGFVGLFWEPIKTFFMDSMDSLDTWASEFGTKISTWAHNTGKSIATWVSDTKHDIYVWVTDTDKKISDWVSNFGTNVATWYDTTYTNIDSWITDTAQKFSTWVVDNTAGIISWATETDAKISTWANNTRLKVSTWASGVKGSITIWSTDTKQKIITWSTETAAKISTWSTDTKQKITTWVSETVVKISSWATETYNAAKTGLANIASETSKKLTETKTTWTNRFNEIKSALGDWWEDMRKSMNTWLDTKVMQPIKDFFNLNTFWNKISGLLSQIKNKFSNWWKDIFDTDVNISSSVSGKGGSTNVRLEGHATGGVFNREHIARFAEGNKAEAIIPLENAGAMQPFVDAVGRGLTSYIAPLVANSGNSNSNLPPLYVGTLVADDRGLKELYRKFEIIQLQENERRGTRNAPVLL